ncbi:Haloacid dehalogenase domain protein hydrolase [Catenulispora acidiphila DSM 44928]|uniref:Haloacid dehalogenase domain protein hydrolase n=1 Tax=Catenulispora acidiphila (strain DSM 44928 / JCM 14897 / NBRC 102108 / NRRL B-24433 / ID139908) TaxID=479433 RepID=C7QH69_CATAD|nr:HAD hydrolase-like protein [Catenulispora acidiphila]ACU76919.1 Haloacid dehalogenase domain protein hydrolase [Catenulispora acidiphila DSM 44928]
MTTAPLTVGFDLDMTLIDSRPGVHATMTELSRRTGVAIDADAVVSRLGPPLDEELAHWFPADRIAAAGDEYRALYPEFAIAPTPALPGAAEAFATIRERGGRVMVVTAKYGPNAALHLEHLDLVPDVLVGWHWGPKKGEALLEHGATVYVGDHLGDILGARAAGAVAVSVATGPVSAPDLAAAGADAVLADLRGFPAWLDGYLAA